MGVGIAIALVDAGLSTIVVGLKYAALARVRFDSDFAATRDCDFAIEAVFESLKVKQQVFAGLDARMPDHAVLTTGVVLARRLRNLPVLVGIATGIVGNTRPDPA